MKTIQVSGSNGKGSTVQLLASIFKVHGADRLGVYIPRPCGGWPFPEICAVDDLPTALGSRMSPFHRLRAAGATLAIVEGVDALGSSPERAELWVGVITMICDDADQPALERARRKMEALARGDPMVVGEVPADCRALIERTARDRGVRLVWALDDVESAISDFADGCATIAVRTPIASYSARLQVRGRYQLRNAIIAIRVGEVCGLPGDIICAGLEACEPLGGRLSYVQRGAQTILIDLLKNPRGAEVLRDYLLERHPGTPVVVRLKAYRAEVANILAPVGPVTFDGAIPDMPFCTVAGPRIADIAQ